MAIGKLRRISLPLGWGEAPPAGTIFHPERKQLKMRNLGNGYRAANNATAARARRRVGRVSCNASKYRSVGNEGPRRLKRNTIILETLQRPGRERRGSEMERRTKRSVELALQRKIGQLTNRQLIYKAWQEIYCPFFITRKHRWSLIARCCNSPSTQVRCHRCAVLGALLYVHSYSCTR